VDDEQSDSGDLMRGVGVVIPAHRAADTIAATLDAVAAQTVAPAAVVVVLDGPDAATEAVVRAHPLAPECLVLPRNTGGPGTPRNVGAAHLIDRPALDAFWFLDADDLPDPRFLEVATGLLRAHPDADLIATDFRRWHGGEHRPADDRDPTTSASSIDLDWYLGNTGRILPSFSLVRSRIGDMPRADGRFFDGALPINQDYDLFVRLLHRGRVVRTDWSGGRYRMHAEGISADGPALWLCRMVTNEGLARWFESRGEPIVARRFQRAAASAMRTAARHLWRRHADGDRARALRLLFDDLAVRPSSKTIAVLLLMPLGLDRRARRIRPGDARLSPV
jgi:glycosyltransferase involved in cell wall biosynthesis